MDTQVNEIPPLNGSHHDAFANKTTETDKSEATRFLSLLDPGTDQFSFQSFDDNADRKDGTLARTLNGTIAQHWNELASLSQNGAGIFVTVQATDGAGRKSTNITRIRALFQEADNGDEPELPLVPHITVQSSPGKYHRYVLVSGMALEQFKGYQQTLVDQYKSDLNAKDIARVLRLPGFVHQKVSARKGLTGKKHMVRITHASGDTPLPLFILPFRPSEKAHSKTDRPTSTPVLLGDPGKVRDALSFLDPDMEYNDWLNIIMCLHSTGAGEEAFEIAEEWSRKGSSYEDGVLEKKWSSFKRDGGDGVTLRTLYHKACEAGWNEGVFEFGRLETDIQQLTPDSMVNTGQCIKRIAGVKLTPVQEESLVKQIKTNTLMNLGAIRAAIRVHQDEEATGPLTHLEMTEMYIEVLSNPKPVGVYGRLWQYDDGDGIWREKKIERVGTELGRMFQDEPLCKRASDYKAVAALVYGELTDESFFSDAPKGIATANGFITVGVDGKLVWRNHSPDNRIRFKLTAEPDYQNQPKKLLSALHKAFKDHHPEEQIRQLQQLTGLALMGMQSGEQVCAFLYGVGASFKSGFQKVLQGLIPPGSVAVVAPSQMNRDYHKASLAGRLINCVPEISRDSPIPAADFKAISGGDRVNCREPYGLPFSFVADCGNWFNSNFLLTTNDHSDGFWRRWSIVYFGNETKRDDRIKDLDEIIIREELSQVLGWALTGVADYLQNGLYFSPEHYLKLETWKRDSNSVSSWLHDHGDSGVVLEPDTPNIFIRVSDAYRLYRQWCVMANRRPYGKSQFKGYMADQGHLDSIRDGNSVFKDIRSMSFTAGVLG